MKLHAIAALLALSAPSCLSLDAFFFSPVKTDAYTFPYLTSDFPEADRPPASLRTELPPLVDEHGTVVATAVFVARPDAERATAATVIYNHGNATNIDGYWERVSRIWALGANVLTYDYCGYGKTPGSPGEACIFAGARAVWAHVKARTDIDQSRVYLYGYSLGSGPASYLAADVAAPATSRSTTFDFAGLILESPFTSVAALAADGGLIVPRSFLMTNAFDNASRIVAGTLASQYGTLIFHGDVDDFVQTKYGRELDEDLSEDPRTASRTNARGRPHCLVIIPGANHGYPHGVPEVGGALYSDTLRAFLANGNADTTHCAP